MKDLKHGLKSLILNISRLVHRLMFRLACRKNGQCPNSPLKSCPLGYPCLLRARFHGDMCRTCVLLLTHRQEGRRGLDQIPARIRTRVLIRR